MKKKVLAGLLAVVGVSIGIPEIMQYVERRSKNLDCQFSQRLTESELCERYPDGSCLADRLKQHLVYLEVLEHYELDVVSVSCHGDSMVSVTLRDTLYVYDIEYNIARSRFHYSKYIREYT